MQKDTYCLQNYYTYYLEITYFNTGYIKRIKYIDRPGIPLFTIYVNCRDVIKELLLNMNH